MVAELGLDWEQVGANVLAWLVTYAIHSTVLVVGAWLVAVAAARLACRWSGLRDLLPGLRERLWKVALVGGLLTATLNSLFGIAPFGWTFVAAADRGHASEIASPEFTRAPTAMRPTAGDPAAFVSPRATEPAPLATIESTPATPWVELLLVLWLLGVGFGLARWICRWNRLLRRLDDRTALSSGPLHARLERLRGLSGARVPVVLSSAPGIDSPLSLGLLRAEICVPLRAERELRAEELDALLAHELAHVERRDTFWIVACRAIEVVFFFQPLNRVCATWLADEAEYLADDWAVAHTGERVGMASCLTEIAGWMVQDEPSRLVAGMAARGTRLTLRVHRLLDESHEPEISTRGTWVTSACAPFGLCAVLFVPGVTADAGTTRSWERQDARFALDPDADHAGSTCDATQTDPAEELESLLSDLEDEVLELQDELALKAGGEPLRARLEVLEHSIAALQDRLSGLRSVLDELPPPDETASVRAAPFTNPLDRFSVHKD